MNGSRCPVSSRWGEKRLEASNGNWPTNPDLYNAESPLIVRDSTLVAASRTSRAACQQARLSGNTRIFTVNDLTTIVSLSSLPSSARRALNTLVEHAGLRATDTRAVHQSRETRL